MLPRSGQKGFTLIELLIVIAIIGILASIAIPMYRAQTIKAKLTEVSNSMSKVSTAVAAYYQEEGRFPETALNDPVAIKSTLGVALPVGVHYVASASVLAGTGTVVFGIMGTGDGTVDGGTLTLSPTTNSVGAINWIWSGSIPQTYIPKK
jgi:prepilin-type N-terminal cleavage/methylation domain-containing protein